ncbi:MAG: 4'-phosphopantetheinyl transferase superfamily protein [Desulfobulbaceae bacterium]|nr:4'-phosphopantetheinyl transferase superfamily protein [Desulfobulbaceae bacterium]HIJ78366.1 4'-phosphopantetheinyl transferase superfamily protein [Deltaproteobacteria bacterium]
MKSLPVESLVQIKKVGPFQLAHVFLPHLAHHLTGGGLEALAARFLGKAELIRLRGFSSEKRRLEWLGGRLAAKAAVAACLGEGEWAARTLEILAEPGGRPYVVGGRDAMPDISVSHSGSLAVAMAADSPCGIDVQEVRQTLIRVADRFADQQERELLAAYLGSAWPAARRLALLWSAKEAVRKMIALEPLLGFNEMALAEIRGAGTPGAPIAMQLFCRRGNDGPCRVEVLAVAEDDYLLALTRLDFNQME